jgi:hypothetical protein
MAHGSRFTRCTAQREDESFCDSPSVPDAPFPICVKHLAQAAEFLTSIAPDVMTAFMISATGVDGSFLRVNAEPYRSVIYYVRVGATIKIGVTGRVKQRMASYPPHSVLLATEPGGDELEKQRHRQFRGDLAAGREWFHPSVDLITHINGLREQPLTAADLAA